MYYMYHVHMYYIMYYVMYYIMYYIMCIWTTCALNCVYMYIYTTCICTMYDVLGCVIF